MSFQPSPEQQAILDFVATSRQNLAIEALAGTGKTTMLLEIARRLPPGGRRLFCAFNRDIVAELERRLQGTGVLTKTFHGIGFAALRKFLGAASMQPDGGKYRTLVNAWADESEALAEAVENAILNAPAEEAETFAKDLKRESRKMAIEVLDWLRYKLVNWDAQEALFEMISQYRLDEEILNDEGITKAIVAAVPFLMKQAEAETRSHHIDFTDMVYWPVFWNAPVDQYQYVFTDEAQDLSPMQRRLIEKCLAPSGRIFVVGDKNQAIYSFAGADSDSFDLSVQTFNCHVLPMTVTRRCAQVVARHAARVVPAFKALPTAPQGKVIWWPEERMLEKIEPGDMILCRLRAPLIRGVLECIGAGVPATILGSEIGKALITILDKVARRKGYSFGDLKAHLNAWKAEQIERYKSRNEEQMAASVEDSVSALEAIMDYAKASSLDMLKGEIDSLFSSRDSKSMVVFTTVHKSKGLEAERVFILAPDKLPLMGGDQEDNLDYVARTRAKSALVYLTNPKFLEKTPRPAYVQTTFEDVAELPAPERPVITVEKPEAPALLSLPAPVTTPEPGLSPKADAVSPVVESGRAALDALKEMDLAVMLEDVAPAPVPTIPLPPQVERITEVLNDLTLTEIDTVIRVLTIYKQVLLKEAALETV